VELQVGKPYFSPRGRSLKIGGAGEIRTRSDMNESIVRIDVFPYRLKQLIRTLPKNQTGRSAGPQISCAMWNVEITLIFRQRQNSGVAKLTRKWRDGVITAHNHFLRLALRLAFHWSGRACWKKTKSTRDCWVILILHNIAYVKQSWNF